MKVLITRRIHERAKECLRAAGVEVVGGDSDVAMRADHLAEAAREADGVLAMLSDKITGELMEAAPRVRVYANYAVGFDNMDVAAATQRGIALSNTPDVLTGATAEIAWALLFAAARRVCEGDRMVRVGEFRGWGPLMLLGYDVAHRTLGIIGAGRIGTAMARRARGFEMRVLYTRRSAESPEMRALGARRVELEELLHESDFISIHTPLTLETRHMIGPKQFDMMKKTAILINTGRGPVVDENALVDALREKRIAAAGLDVYEREPALAPGLAELDNAVLLPHIGSATHEARCMMAELAAQNVLDYFGGKVPRTCINPDYVNNPK